jgi:hypothetical protein
MLSNHIYFDKWNGKKLAKEMLENTPYVEENITLTEQMEEDIRNEKYEDFVSKEVI